MDEFPLAFFVIFAFIVGGLIYLSLSICKYLLWLLPVYLISYHGGKRPVIGYFLALTLWLMYPKLYFLGDRSADATFTVVHFVIVLLVMLGAYHLEPLVFKKYLEMEPNLPESLRFTGQSAKRLADGYKYLIIAVSFILQKTLAPLYVLNTYRKTFFPISNYWAYQDTIMFIASIFMARRAIKYWDYQIEAGNRGKNNFFYQMFKKFDKKPQR